MATQTATYTDDQVTSMVAAYTEAQSDESRAEVVETFANDLGKSVASVRSKLVREGVYVKKTRTTKTGASIVSKADLVTQIEAAAGAQPGDFDSLEKATKNVLVAILGALS